MGNLKTKTNKKGAGRPKCQPTRVVSLRIRENVYEALKKKYTKNWMSLFQDFLYVYKVDADENGGYNLK